MNKNRNQKQQVSDVRKSLREKAEEMECRARYWRAIYEIRKYTLDAEVLRPDYDVYIEKERQETVKQMEELKKEAENSNGQLKVEGHNDPVGEDGTPGVKGIEVLGDPSEQASSYALGVDKQGNII